MESIKRRGLQENDNIFRTKLVAKRRIVIEESKSDTQSLFNDSEDSKIERMFEGLSDYEDESFESDHKKYSIGTKVNKKKGCISKKK